MQLDMFCPYHLKDEKLELPDSHRYFQGEWKCSPEPGDTPQTLQVWVIRGFLVDVKVV